nr:hypothetical protein [Tanacetum cinerariifolium]
MAFTFADTYNMIAFLTNSNASEGFEHIIDFLNAHVIKYALMVNQTIYVSCIKQFLTYVSIKKTKDVMRLQALIDRKKVIITEDSIREALPNKEIFAKLARKGYEKPSTKVDTPLFAGMLVPQQDQDVEDAAKDGDAVNEVSDEPTPPSPTPATPPPPPPPPQQEHIPSPLQAKTAQSSPPPQQQPLKTAKISMTLLNTLLETCATLTKQGRLEESQANVYHLDLEHADKVLSMLETDEAEPAEVDKVIEVVTAAKGVIIQDPEEAATASVSVQSEVKSKDKGKRILVKEPKPLKRQAQIEYGLAKVKSWKPFESSGFHIIAFTNSQMILLVERKYPLTRFTLEQMLNNVRLEVKEESEMSLDLLRLLRRQQQEGYKQD